jgi:hypothetical protein
VRELVGIAALIPVYHSDCVSDELIHAVVTLTGAHFCYGGGIDSFLDYPLARAMLVIDAVVRLGHV